jgi:hypothetical protein
VTGITAKVIEDSINMAGIRLTTLQLRYPRFIHAEFMTHRVFSRNASSSRAIPVNKMLAQVWNDPAAPIHWGANQAGMQAKEELKGWRRKVAQGIWRWSGRMMCGFVWAGMKIGMHKQTANRLLEPWQFIHVIVTATEWENFFALRDHPDAQPEIHALAIVMREAMKASYPRLLTVGEWHLPYITHAERRDFIPELLVKLSAARCARVSYLTHDGQAPALNKDLDLYDRLVGSVPLHASPIEHQGTPMHFATWSGNFRGWTQYRKRVEQQLAQGE